MNVKRKNSNDGKDGMGEGRGRGKEEKRQTKWRERVGLSVRRCAAQCGLVWGSLFPTGTSAAELVAGRLERGVWYGIRNVFVSQTEWAQSQTGRGSDGLILTLLVRAVALNH